MTTIFGVIILLVLGWIAFGLLSGDKVSAPASGIFFEAVKDFDAGLLDSSEKKLLEHVATNREHVQSYLYLLKIYQSRGKRGREIQTLKTLMELWTSGFHEFKVGEIQRGLADHLYDKEEFEEAFFYYAALLKGINVDPGVEPYGNTQEFVDESVLRKVAFLLGSQGRYEKALEYYEKLVTQNPKDWDSVRGQVPCLVGTGDFNGAERCIRLLITNKEVKLEDYYYLGKIYQQLGDDGNAYSAFMEFIQKMSHDNAYDGYDALSFLIRGYFSKSGPGTETELENWIRVFRAALDYIFLKDHQEKELLLQKGFLHFFRNHKKGEFREALKEWSNLILKDPKYRNVDQLLERVKNYKADYYNEIEAAFKESGAGVDDLFEAPRVFKASEMYDVLPFESDVVAEFFDPSLLGGLKKTFKKGKKQTPKDLLNLSISQFDRRIEEVFTKKSLVMEKKLKADSSGVAFNYLLKNKANKFIYGAVYRSASEIGEVEVKQVMSEMKKSNLVGAVMISMGSFTVKAANLARNNNIEVISGMILEDKFLNV